MAQIIKEIRVDVSQPCNLQAILAKQYDCNSRFLKITLTDCGTKINVSNTSKVTINTNRPDGQSKSFNGTANTDGTVTVPLPQWSLSVVGDLKCDVSVTDTSTNERLTTMDIWVNVIEAANDNTDISENPDGEITVITPSRVIDENSTNDEYPSSKAVYDYGQSILADTELTATAQGNAITIESSKAPLQNLKLYGKTTKNETLGTLSSTGDSGSFNVGVYGKNLVKNTATTQTINGVTFTVNEDKSITVSGTATEDALFNVGTITIKANVGYTLTGCPSGGSHTTYYLEPAGFWYDVGLGYRINHHSNFSVNIRIVVKSGTTMSNSVFKPMLRLDVGTDKTYEPYKEKQSITLTDTLRGVGEVKDEIDFARGVKIQRFGIVDLGTFDWMLLGTNTFRAKTEIESIKIPKNDTTPINALCSHYVVSDFNTMFGEQIDHLVGLAKGNRLITVVDKSYTDASALKSAVSGVYLVYELETPIETPLTETELNAYRQLMTNKGTTTVLNSEGADTEITYYVNKPNAQAVGNIHTQINKDYLKLQQAIIETGGN